MKSSTSHVPNSRKISNFKSQFLMSPDLIFARRKFPGTWNLELGALLACAVCGGAHSTSPLAQGMNWGIFTLMGFVVSVLAGIAFFFVHIVRKEEAANSNPPSPDRPAQL